MPSTCGSEITQASTSPATPREKLEACCDTATLSGSTNAGFRLQPENMGASSAARTTKAARPPAPCATGTGDALARHRDLLQSLLVRLRKSPTLVRELQKILQAKSQPAAQASGPPRPSFLLVCQKELEAAKAQPARPITSKDISVCKGANATSAAAGSSFEQLCRAH